MRLLAASITLAGIAFAGTAAAQPHGDSDMPPADKAVSTGFATDTSETSPAAAADSTSTADSTALPPSSRTSHAAGAGGGAVYKRPAAAAPDTSIRFYDSPFMGVGVGWTLGGLSLFDVWKEGLPDSLGAMAGYTAYADSHTVSYTDLEPPDAYNTAFPFSLSFSPVVHDKGYLSVAATLWFMSKDYVAVWRTDSARTFWHVERELSLIATSLGLVYHYGIPAEFFSIANVDRAHLTVGLAASPYVKITDQRSESSDIAGFDISTKREYRGYGLTWLAGISTLRPLSQRAGIEIAVAYEGHWIGRFIRDDHHVLWSAISDEGERPGDALDFISHRFKIYFNLIVGGKPARTGPAVKPRSSTSGSSPAVTTPSAHTSNKQAGTETRHVPEGGKGDSAPGKMAPMDSPQPLTPSTRDGAGQEEEDATVSQPDQKENPDTTETP